jgi:hypothetical protein
MPIDGGHNMSHGFPKPNFKQYLAPDEELSQVKSIYSQLVDELDPSNYLEVRQIELITLCDLEMSRHRRQSAQLLASTSRSIEAQEIRNSMPAHQTKLKNGEISAIKVEKLQQIIAKAYERDVKLHSHHEACVAKLEARRRNLLSDYQAMKKLSQRNQNADVEVAKAEENGLGVTLG